jgi:hypothetical protein
MVYGNCTKVIILAMGEIIYCQLVYSILRDLDYIIFQILIMFAADYLKYILKLKNLLKIDS